MEHSSAQMAHSSACDFGADSNRAALLMFVRTQVRFQPMPVCRIAEGVVRLRDLGVSERW